MTVAVKLCEVCGEEIVIGGTFTKSGRSKEGHIVFTMMTAESLGYFTNGGEFECPNCHTMLPKGKYFATNR